jgi:hypothetical protein
MPIELADLACAVGMTKEQARLWAACCAAHDHYLALKRSYADRRLIAQAKQKWDDAAVAYMQSERSR